MQRVRRRRPRRSLRVAAGLAVAALAAMLLLLLLLLPDGVTAKTAARHSPKTSKVATSIHLLTDTLALLSKVNATCDQAVEATCKRTFTAALLFGTGTAGSQACEEFLTLKRDRERANASSIDSNAGGRNCDVNFSSCTAVIPAWRGECFEDAAQCEAIVHFSYSGCPMGDQRQHPRAHPLDDPKAFLAAHPVDAAPSVGGAPQSSTQVLDRAFRMQLSCILLFRELCTDPVLLHATAGMSGAECATALEDRLPRATLPVGTGSACAAAPLMLSSSSSGQQPSLPSVALCNESVARWRVDCYPSLDACRSTAAAAHPDRCNREAVARDSQALGEISVTHRVEAILAALTGPNATRSTKIEAATHHGNKDFLTNHLEQLQQQRKEVGIL